MLSPAPSLVLGFFLRSFRSKIARLDAYQTTEHPQYKPDSPILVQLQGSYNYIAGVDTNRRRGAVRFVTLNSVNIHNPLLAVHLRDFSFPAFKFAAHDAYFVVFTDGDCSNLLNKSSSVSGDIRAAYLLAYVIFRS